MVMTVKVRYCANAVNVGCRPCSVERVPPAPAPPWCCSLFCCPTMVSDPFIEIAQSLPALRFGPSPGWATTTSADFSAPVPPHCCRSSPCERTETEISSGKAYLLLTDPSDLPTVFRMTIGLPRPWPGDQHCKASNPLPVTSSPRFRRRLSSDPASRQTPLPGRMVPVITVHGGLSPLECKSY